MLCLVEAVRIECHEGGEDGVIAVDGLLDPANEIEQNRGVAAQDER